MKSEDVRVGSDQLFEQVYSELRQLARNRLVKEKGDSLQATALVHEAYIKIVGGKEVDWENTGHFFGAAAESMRRILVDRARSKHALKRGGSHKRVDFDQALVATDDDSNVLMLDEAIEALQSHAPRKAEVVKLRYFAGLNNNEVASALRVSTKTAERDWAYSKAWLRRKIQDDPG